MNSSRNFLNIVVSYLGEGKKAINYQSIPSTGGPPGMGGPLRLRSVNIMPEALILNWIAYIRESYAARPYTDGAVNALSTYSRKNHD